LLLFQSCHPKEIYLLNHFKFIITLNPRYHFHSIKKYNNFIIILNLKFLLHEFVVPLSAYIYLLSFI
jgi:hypothetical protein